MSNPSLLTDRRAYLHMLAGHRGLAVHAASWLATGLIAALALDYAAAACILRYHLDPLLFPASRSADKAGGPGAIRILSHSGAELRLQRQGQLRIGCAIFFPGQHGEVAAYHDTLFRQLVDSGVAVFAVTYPGQGGAAGSARLSEIPDLGHRAVLRVMQDCAPHRTVVLGRSLGAVIAAYAAAGTSPAGIVLDSTAPELSSAISARIRSRWYLRPLALLPVPALLHHDYSLAEALARLPGVPVILFQGTADRQTPIRDLQQTGALPANVRLVPVAGASHSSTLRLALGAYVKVVVGLIRGGTAVREGSLTGRAR